MDQESGLPSTRIRYMLIIKNLTFLYSHFLPLAIAIQQAGCDVWVVAGNTADPKRLTDLGIHYVPVHPAKGAWDIRGEAQAVMQIHHATKRIKPDIVHFIYLKNVLAGGILARINRVPFVIGAITGLGNLFIDERMIYRCLCYGVLAGLKFGFHRPNTMIAIENSDDESVLAQAGVTLPGHIGVIPGAGVNRNFVTVVPSEAICPIILCTSRMIRPKGVVELIEACHLLSQQGMQFELWLAGDVDRGNPQSMTAEELQNAESSGHVKWLGHRTDIGDLLQKCSIFCLPSYREGLSLSLIEATAAGRAIVTTDTPGCRDIVTHGVNGLLVKPKDAVELSEALKSLLLSARDREEMGAESRRIFEARYTINSVLSAFNKIYSTLGVDLKLNVNPKN